MQRKHGVRRDDYDLSESSAVSCRHSNLDRRSRVGPNRRVGFRRMELHGVGAAKHSVSFRAPAESSVPVKVPGNPGVTWTEISANEGMSCGISTNHAYCWGTSPTKRRQQLVGAMLPLFRVRLWNENRWHSVVLGAEPSRLQCRSRTDWNRYELVGCLCRSLSHVRDSHRRHHVVLGPKRLRRAWRRHDVARVRPRRSFREAPESEARSGRFSDGDQWPDLR